MNQMEYFILINGCSFSCSFNEKEKAHRQNRKCDHSYVDFLPGKCWNIARRGSGIETERIKKFIRGDRRPWLLDSHLYGAKFNKGRTARHARLECSKGVELTHFIYQIPCPARQSVLAELSEEEFLQAPMSIEFYTKELIDEVLYKGRSGKWTTVLRRLKNNKDISIIFDKQDTYLKKALCEVHKHVNIVRDSWPTIKVIFLRYERTDVPLLSEFCKDWYKTTLSNYCKENNITYIYENNFNTKWFKKRKLSSDLTHPNEAGAKLIADKIKEYL